MRRIVIYSLIALLLVSTPLFAAFDPTEADALFDTDYFDEAKALLLEALPKATTAPEEAEILWRLARVMVSIGDEIDKEDKAGRFAAYEEGEAYAITSIERNPTANGYLWKCSNVGRWGQTKGPLNSLSKARGMLADLTVIINDFGALDSTETWYILSSLYYELPPVISFGNNDWAISYARIAMEHIPSHLLYPGHYERLAEELYNRNWSASKRTRELAKMQKKWEKACDNLVRYRYYEGAKSGANTPFYSSVPLTAMSDRQEAEMLLSYIIAKYDVFPYIKRADTRTIKKLIELRDSWR